MASNSDYANERIDHLDKIGDAQDGKTVIDLRKVLWSGSMFLLGTIGAAVFFSASALILFFVTTVICIIFGHSLGMHRRFIHRSFECPRWFEYTLVHLGTLVGIAGPLGMLHTHDTRDWAQRQAACHTYFSHGLPCFRDFIVQVFCSFNFRHAPKIVIEPEIANDPIYQWMEKTWMLQQLPWAVIFYSIGGLPWVCWGIGARVTVCTIGHWLIGFFAHNSGQRDWHVEDAAVQGFNVPWCSLITCGESYHNNHHAFPGSARFDVMPNQWDPGWTIIKALQAIGLVSKPVTYDQLPARRELARLGERD